MLFVLTRMNRGGPETRNTNRKRESRKQNVETEMQFVAYDSNALTSFSVSLWFILLLDFFRLKPRLSMFVSRHLPSNVGNTGGIDFGSDDLFVLSTFSENCAPRIDDQ